MSVLFLAWALQRGFLTAKASRPDVYRAANHILRLALDGRINLCLRPPGFTAEKGMSISLLLSIVYLVIQSGTYRILALSNLRNKSSPLLTNKRDLIVTYLPAKTVKHFQPVTTISWRRAAHRRAIKGLIATKRPIDSMRSIAITTTRKSRNR